jgi:DMSO/TMAO reductase YedYZ molybdopterin-dependent catalytic subunit
VCVPETTLPPFVAAPLATGNDAEFGIPGQSPLFTPVSSFYVTDVAFPPPVPDRAAWRLRIAGLVANPVVLSFDELVALPSVEIDAALICVHNPVGGRMVGNGRWQGVPVATLLARAGMLPGADHVLAGSVDGFSGGFPLTLLHGDWTPIVVFGLNGRPLTPDHGAPARLLVPGVYGYDASVKWLSSLEVTRFESARDYSERKGWPRKVAHVQCQARIDVPAYGASLRPGRQIVAGVAWSPPSGVTGVEIRIDGGDWLPCELAAELSPAAWRQWRVAWEAPDGWHSLEVRAHDRHGAQYDRDRPPFPAGATGYHTVGVEVTGSARRWPGARLRLAAADLAGRLRLAHAGISAWRTYRASGTRSP